MSTLRAAAGQVDLRPPPGGWMTGFAARIEPAAGSHDPIMARAVLLDDGAARLAIVSCDLIGFTAEAVYDLRRRIAQRASVPASNILIACTHTHSGPASMPFRGVMGHVDHVWLASAQRRIVDLVCALPDALQPARLACAAAQVPGLGYNRQDRSRPIDEELGVIAVDALDGAAIATLLNYAAHAVVLGPHNLEYSGDYPGEAMRQVVERRGGVGLFLLGACGDVDPVVYRDRGWGTGTFDDARAMGGRLAEAAAQALSRAAWSDNISLSVISETLDLPLDPPPAPDQLRELMAELESDRQQALANADRRGEWIALAMLDWARELDRALYGDSVPTALPVELFAAAIGDARVVAVPLEPYSDISLDLKARLRPRRAIFAGYSNGLFGYCAPSWAKAQGGYGPDNSARWFPSMLTAIGDGAAERVVEEAAALVASLESGSSTTMAT